MFARINLDVDECFSAFQYEFMQPASEALLFKFKSNKYMQTLYQWLILVWNIHNYL